MTDIKAAQDRLKELESAIDRAAAEAANLRKIIEQPKQEGLWRPRKGDGYYVVDSSGDIANSFWDDDGCDHDRLVYGNVFPSAEAVKKAAPWFAKSHKFIQAAFQADPDAGERSAQRMYTAGCENGAFVSGGSRYMDTIHVHTRDQADEMARLLNAERGK